MDVVRSSILNYRKWLHNPRYLIIAVLIMIFANNVSSAFLDIANRTDTRLSVWIFPFFMYDRYLQFCISLCLVMFFCDAPFMDNLHPYCLQRIGRKKWFIGQCIYITVGSAVFFALLWLCMILICIKRIEFSFEWGTCLELLARDNPFWGAFAPDIILHRNPMITSLEIFTVSCLVGTLFGILLMSLNVYIRREAGAFVVCGISVIDYFLCISFDEQKWLFWLSPVSWLNPQQYGEGDYWKLFARIAILIAAITAFAYLSFRKIKKINIETAPEI